MSEIHRPAPAMLDQVGVGGMLGYDNLDKELTRGLTREAATPSGETYGNLETGLDDPVPSGRSEKKATCVRSVLLGMRKLCRENGLNEAFTAYLVGRLAMDLCHSDPPEINSVI